MFNCQHGIDRTAGDKKKQKDAEEVLYIIISLYPQPLCFCQLNSLLIQKVKYMNGLYDIDLRILL